MMIKFRDVGSDFATLLWSGASHPAFNFSDGREVFIELELIMSADLLPKTVGLIGTWSRTLS